MSPTWKWMVSILGTIVFTGAGAWMTHIAAQQDDLNDRLVAQAMDTRQAEGKTGERMMRVETKLENLEKTAGDLRDGQREMNQKLDQIIQQVPRDGRSSSSPR